MEIKDFFENLSFLKNNFQETQIQQLLKARECEVFFETLTKQQLEKIKKPKKQFEKTIRFFISFTKRQRILLLSDESLEQMAERLNLSIQTVKVELEKINEKLELLIFLEESINNIDSIPRSALAVLKLQNIKSISQLKRLTENEIDHLGLSLASAKAVKRVVKDLKEKE